MKATEYSVLVLYQDLPALPLEIWRDRGRNVFATSPLDACERALMRVLTRPWPAQAIVYVSLGSQRHENGTPMCVQRYLVNATECEAQNA